MTARCTAPHPGHGATGSSGSGERTPSRMLRTAPAPHPCRRWIFSPPGCSRTPILAAENPQAGSAQSRFLGQPDELGPVAHTELLVDVVPVRLDRPDRHVERGADLGVGMPEGDQTESVPLP